MAHVIHLAYVTKADASGASLIIITPRWVIVNRSHWTLYAAPAHRVGINAQDAAAAASA